MVQASAYMTYLSLHEEQYPLLFACPSAARGSIYKKAMSHGKRYLDACFHTDLVEVREGRMSTTGRDMTRRTLVATPGWYTYGSRFGESRERISLSGQVPVHAGYMWPYLTLPHEYAAYASR